MSLFATQQMKNKKIQLFKMFKFIVFVLTLILVLIIGYHSLTQDMDTIIFNPAIDHLIWGALYACIGLMNLFVVIREKARFMKLKYGILFLFFFIAGMLMLFDGIKTLF